MDVSSGTCSPGQRALKRLCVCTLASTQISVLCNVLAVLPRSKYRLHNEQLSPQQARKIVAGVQE